MMQPMNKQPKMVPPDGGWGWVIVFGVALTNTFNQSLLSIYGLIFGEKLVEMGENTVGAALVGNIMLVVTNFAGLIAGPALKYYSSRQVAMVASLLSGMGMIGASYATTSWHFIATYSVFTGLGIGLLQPSTFMAVNAYFTKKRGRAVGVSMAGTGIGQMLMPHLVRYLLDSFGFKGTAFILGGLAFNGLAGASLFQPVEQHLVPAKEEEQPLLSTKNRKVDSEEEIDSLEDEIESFFGNDKQIPKTLKNKKRSYSSCDVLTISETPEKEHAPIKKSKEGVFTKIKNLFDLDILLDCVFLNIIIGCSLGFTSNQNFNMLFPFFLQQQVGLSRPDTAMCMSALAAADIVARLTIPIATDRYRISARISYFVSCITLTAARVVLTMQSEYNGLMYASALNGFCRSTIIINQTLMVSEYFDKNNQKLPTALGMNMVVKGLCIITIGQFLGWIRDYTGSYIICIQAQTALLVIIVILWIPEFIFKKCCFKNS